MYFQSFLLQIPALQPLHNEGLMSSQPVVVSCGIAMQEMQHV
jgi:hypothetical protein